MGQRGQIQNISDPEENFNMPMDIKECESPKIINGSQNAMLL